MTDNIFPKVDLTQEEKELIDRLSVPRYNFDDVKVIIKLQNKSFVHGLNEARDEIDKLGSELLDHHEAGALVTLEILDNRLANIINKSESK